MLSELPKVTLQTLKVDFVQHRLNKLWSATWLALE